MADPPLDHSPTPTKRLKLPRGPHALPQDVVVAHQRERLLDAAAPAMADKGYAELTVRDLIDRAGVSRRTFYQLFDDKLDCVFAAHERAFEPAQQGDRRRLRGRRAIGPTASPPRSPGRSSSRSSRRRRRSCRRRLHTASEPKLAQPRARRPRTARRPPARRPQAGREVAHTPPELDRAGGRRRGDGASSAPASSPAKSDRLPAAGAGTGPDRPHAVPGRRGGAPRARAARLAGAPPSRSPARRPPRRRGTGARVM